MPTDILSFSVIPHVRWSTRPWSVIPNVNDVRLTELVTEFEQKEQFEEPIGGYGGLLPDYFSYGPLERYFLADFEPGSYFEKYGIYFLGCHCGEVGCWPLRGQIITQGDSVIWRNFKQPHRHNRDYSRFGPFVFDIQQYKESIAKLSADYSTLTAGPD